jgi:general secretion pathway protein G
MVTTFKMRYRINLTPNRGITLIELLIVLTIIALLLTISVPKFWNSVDVAKERVLQENINTTRVVIQQFYVDNGRYPNSLNELVERKYLRSLPIDPVSELALKTLSPPLGQGGNVYDVKPNIQGKSRSGKLYEDF